MDTSWSNMFSVRISGHNPFFSDLKFADLRKKPKVAKGSTASSSGDSGNGLEDSLGEADQSLQYKPTKSGKRKFHFHVFSIQQIGLQFKSERG